MRERFSVIAGARFWYIIDRDRGGKTVSQWMESEGAQRMARLLNRKEAYRSGRQEAQETTQESVVASETG